MIVILFLIPTPSLFPPLCLDCLHIDAFPHFSCFLLTFSLVMLFTLTRSVDWYMWGIREKYSVSSIVKIL